MCAQLLLCIRLFVTPWTVALQALLSMGFPRQEYWSGLSIPPPRDLPNPGVKPASPVSPALQVDSLLLSHQRTVVLEKTLESPLDCKEIQPVHPKGNQS